METAINKERTVTDEVVEKFQPTSGRIPGVLALLIVAAIVLIGVLDREQGFGPTVVWAALCAGVLVWSSMLRPGLWATESALVMRNMLSTISIPLVAIEQIVLGQVLAVRAGEGRYVSPAVGKSWRQSILSNRGERRQMPWTREPKGATTTYAAFVEERLHQLAEEARVKSGVTLLSDEQAELAAGVRREWAWLEIAALTVTALGFVVSLFL